MKLYISGPMTGIEDYNFPAFNAAADRLRTAGYDVVNPADGGADESKTWADYLRDDLRLLLDCDAVALLPGWDNSKGAALEVHVARQLGLTVQMLTKWLPDASATCICDAFMTCCGEPHHCTNRQTCTGKED